MLLTRFLAHPPALERKYYLLRQYPARLEDDDLVTVSLPHHDAVGAFRVQPRGGHLVPASAGILEAPVWTAPPVIACLLADVNNCFDHAPSMRIPRDRLC